MVSAGISDLGNPVFRLHQHLLRFLQAVAAQILLRRHPRLVHENTIEIRPVNPYVTGNLTDLYGIAVIMTALLK